MRTARRLLTLLGATLLGLLALLAALWLWSGHDSSLATALAQAPRFLPAGHTLQAREVSGSLRHGGRIGWLRWQHDGLAVEVQQLRIGWRLPPLLARQLQLDQLSIGLLHIDDQRPPEPDAPLAPPTDLGLPIALELPLRIDQLILSGRNTLQVDQIEGHYKFQDQRHRLRDLRFNLAAGSYTLQGQLQAQAPMALALQATGSVRTELPASAQPLTIQARAQLQGELASRDAKLALQASLAPDAATPPGRAGALQAKLQATLAPWQVQPLSQAQAQWQALNLAELWPQAPQTRLSGSASVSPMGAGWQARLQTANTLAGAWNQQRLPIRQLRATVGFEQGQWALQALQAQVAGGQIDASGRFSQARWQGRADILAIDPALIDTRWGSARISGQLSAEQLASGIGFQLQLQAPSGAPAGAHQTADALHALQLHGVQAQGVWAAPLLRLQSLQLDATQARLQGQLSYHTQTQASQAQLSLTLPGLQGTLDGQLAPRQGQGELKLQLTDAEQATRWFSQVPAIRAALGGAHLRGSSELQAHWQGGWQRPQDLRLNAQWQAPRLDWVAAQADATPSASHWQLRQLRAELSGTLADFQLDTQGQVRNGDLQVDWQTQASAGQRQPGHWQGRLKQLTMNAQTGAQPGRWVLQTGRATDSALSFDWQRTRLSQQLDISGGTARLQAPLPGTAVISWQPLRWSQPAQGAGMPRSQWQSQGRISDLPLAWLDAAGLRPMAELGLSSGLILGAQWQAAQTDRLRVRATLERQSGDLQLRPLEKRQLALPAGVRNARVQLQLDDADVATSLLWDSERLGQANITLRSQLQQQAGQWTWPGSAPLSGQLQITMPPVDAWSALAPPGWRLRGTLDAQATLSGSLQAPQWQGSLQARDLAVRSVADGIDFQQGKLKASLQGERLVIEEFTLAGAGGATTGGLVTLTGNAQWLGQADAAKPAAPRLQVTLEAQAKALVLSTRSDRRVTVSGNLVASLMERSVTLRGKLVADQAMITLPEDSTPSLSDDVVVRRPLAATVASKPASQASPPFQPDVLVTLGLGPNFQVRGRGLQARLVGNLELRAQGQATPSLSGNVRTVRGTYKAYGQQLDIEQGVLRFTGPVDNPSLDILAIRPKLSQRVGVQVNGTVLSPVVRLYAEPDLPDAEKLAWLVLGRSSSGSGGEAALLQQAALSLLGGGGPGLSAGLTAALGLDELSLKGSDSTSATGATVTLGKRLSNDFYMAYESSLTGSMGMFSIFYDLSRRLTLRAQTGEQSAIDLIYTMRYD